MSSHSKKLVTSFLLLSILSLGLGSNVYADGEKWKVRLRGIAVVPDDSSNNIRLNTNTQLTAGVEIDEAIVPELDITYMITPHWGVEAIAGVTNHDVSIDGTDAILAGLGAVDGFKIFDLWVLPPTVTLQYHFLPENNIRPYVGAGINYTATFGDNATSALEAALGSPVKVSTENSWGYALQAGVDYDINDSWFMNLDVKYIDIDTTAKLVYGGGNELRVDLDVDPWVIGAGIGYRF